MANRTVRKIKRAKNRNVYATVIKSNDEVQSKTTDNVLCSEVLKEIFKDVGSDNIDVGDDKNVYKTVGDKYDGFFVVVDGGGLDNPEAPAPAGSRGEDGGGAFFKIETSRGGDGSATRAASARPATLGCARYARPLSQTVSLVGENVLGPYKPVPPPKPIAGSAPAYRMPPRPPASDHPPPALPGSAPPPMGELHTHSNKFPIEREVILSSSDKNSKIPILNELKKRAGKVGVAIAPDVPPKQLAAWTHTHIENQQTPQPGSSTDQGYRQTFHEYTAYGAVPRNYATQFNQDVSKKNEELSTSIQIPDSGKESTKNTPKSSTKSVTKTYHTLKDIISSKFKTKDNNDDTRGNDEGLNNVTEEMRKSLRERLELENNATPQRETHGIYGKPMPQQRLGPESSYSPHMQAVHQYPSPHQHMMAAQQQFLKQQINQQQMILNQQHHMLGHSPSTMMAARSQELLSRPHSHLPERPQSQLISQLTTNDSIYYQPQYGAGGRRGMVGPTQGDGYNVANFTSLNQTSQLEHGLRLQARSPQQMEREVALRERTLAEVRRAASQPQLPGISGVISQQSIAAPQAAIDEIPTSGRRGSHGNVLDIISRANRQKTSIDQDKDSDDGGFRSRTNAHSRSFDSRTGDETPNRRSHQDLKKTNENGPQKQDNASSSLTDSGFNSTPQTAQRQVQNRIEDGRSGLKNGKTNPGSAASSDYDKNGGQSSNVDSGRGSAAYSSGRRVGSSGDQAGPCLDTSAESDAIVPGVSEQQNLSNKGQDSEWVDIVESELRQILEPKLQNLNLNGAHSTLSESVSSVTPPLPPLSPGGSTSNATPRNSGKYKLKSVPHSSRAEYPSEPHPRNQRSPGPGSTSRAYWSQHNSHKHRNATSKRDHHPSSSHYRKHLFGLDTTDLTSTTTRSLDLSSLLDGQSDDSEVSVQDARAIRQQLRGLESMYSEVLQLLGVRKPPGKYQPSDPRIAKRRYGSMSSLPSSSVSSRPVRDRRRGVPEHRKKIHDIKSINKRFQRLESHVVTLARSVAHLSSEMRTQHLMMQEMENIRVEISALRSMQRSQSLHRMSDFNSPPGILDPTAFTNPHRVRKLTKFFGDEPPLMRLFLKKLGYEKYAPLFEAERVGAAELPYVNEERLRSLGVPLGPRLRILREAGTATLPTHLNNNPRDNGGTTTTLCIV